MTIQQTAKKSRFQRSMFATALCLASFASANAGMIVPFNVGGQGITSWGTFTVEPNVSPPDPNPACGTPGNNPCRADPPSAWKITRVTGTFSDSKLGITNALITGLIPIDPTNERDPTFDPLVPTSLSYLPSGLTYNNLFFPNGSPIDCAFPFTGTFLDVFGVAFDIAGGDTAVIWGDGNEGPGRTLTYGVAVAEGAKQLDYHFDGIGAGVPEPITLALFGAGLGGVAALRRRRGQIRVKNTD